MSYDKIRYHYNRKTFFGGPEYTEDETYLTKCSLKKALSAFKRDRESAVHLNLTGRPEYLYICLIWDSIKDFDGDIVTVRTYTAPNAYGDTRKSYNKAKKEIYKLLEVEQ